MGELLMSHTLYTSLLALSHFGQFVCHDAFGIAMLKTILSDHSSGLRPAVLDSKTLGPTWLRMAHSVQLVSRGGMVHLAGNPFFSYSLFLHRERPREGLGHGIWDLGPGTWNL